MRTLLALLILSAVALATPVVVQHGPGCNAATGAIGCTLGSSVVSGNAVWVGLAYRLNAATAPTSVVGTRVTYTLVKGDTTGAQEGSWLYCGIAASSGTETVTATMNGTYFFGHVVMAEISGSGGCTADGTSGFSSSTSQSSVTCGTITTSLTGTLVIAVGYDNTGSSNMGIGATYTQIELNNSGANRSSGFESKPQASPGSQSPSFSTGTASATSCVTAGVSDVNGTAGGTKMQAFIQ